LVHELFQPLDILIESGQALRGTATGRTHTLSLGRSIQQVFDCPA
jgi:hypothetical protein